MCSCLPSLSPASGGASARTATPSARRSSWPTLRTGLLPQVGYRQYVLTIPKRVRWYVNQNAALPGEISRILAREIELFLRKSCAGTAAAQLHFIQRAGRSLNLHPHVHAVVSEGRFSSEPGLLGPKLSSMRLPRRQSGTSSL